MADAKSLGTVTGSRIHYEGGRNITYDLSGEDPRFSNQDTIVVFNPGQVHSFVIPVYIKPNDDDTSKQVFKVEKLVSGSLGSGEWKEISRDDSKVDGWSPVEIDVPSMSQAYLLDSTFKGELVKSIQLHVLSGAASDKVYVRITYQRFYQDLYDYNGFDGIGPSYTPALGKYVLDKLQDIEARVATNIANTFASSDNVNDMLEEDLTGMLPANYVQDEPHDVRTTEGIDTLMPARGSFYEHDLRVWEYKVRTGTVQMANKQYNLENQAIFVYQITSTVGASFSKVVTTKRVYLTEENYDDYIGMSGSFIDRAQMTLMSRGVDYELINLNTAKTEKSESEYGVYDTIRMLKAYTGKVMMTYHAFGGAVVFEDVKDMRIDLINTMRILTSKNLITSDVLDKQPVIRELLDRMLVVEQYHNHFNRVEHAIYMGQKGFHWFNIAEIYDVAWGEDLSVIDELGSFRVESLVRGWCYEFALSVDLKKRLVNALRCKTIATNDMCCTDLKNYITYLNQRDDVAIRLCWVGDGTKSGIMLQLGWNFAHYPDPINGVDTDTLVVTNKSGMTSKWRLVYNPLDNTYDSPSSKHICNHTTYGVTEDTVWQDNKDYYYFESIYTYYRTASETVKADVQYYTVDTSVSADANYYVPVVLKEGESIAHYITDPTASPYCPNGIYERALFKKVPRILTNGVDYKPGDPIPDPDNVFEPSDQSYAEDTMFLMPSTQHYWADGVEGCHKLATLLEPNDGYLAWAGNVPLELSVCGQYTTAGENKYQTYIDLNSLLPEHTLKIFDPSMIKGMTFKVYDRMYERIVSCRADVGYCEAAYKVTSDTTAKVSTVYYERTGDGSVASPYRYFKSSVPVGASLEPKGKYFEKDNESRAIGQVIFNLIDLCGGEVEAYMEDGMLRFCLDVYLGTYSRINHRFDLRQIELHF